MRTEPTQNNEKLGKEMDGGGVSLFRDMGREIEMGIQRIRGRERTVTERGTTGPRTINIKWGITGINVFLLAPASV